MVPARVEKNPSLAWRRTIGLFLVGLVLLVPAGLQNAPRLSARDEEKPGQAVLPPDLALVSPDAIGFVHVRLADLWNGPAGKTLRQQFTKEETQLKESLKRSLGLLRPEEAERVTFVSWSLPGWGGPQPHAARMVPAPQIFPRFFPQQDIDLADDEVMVPLPAGAQGPGRVSNEEALEVAVVTTAKPFKDDVLTALLGEWEQQTYKEKTYYTSKGQPALRPAFYALDDRTYVVGSVPAIKKLIDRPAQKEIKGPLAEALKLITPERQVVGALGLSENNSQKLKEQLLGEMGFGAEAMLLRALQPLLDVRFAALTLQVGKEVRTDVHLHFASEATAREARLAAQDALVLLRIFAIGSWLEGARSWRESAPTPQEEENALFGGLLAKKVEVGVRAAEIELRGNSLHASVLAQPDLLALKTEAQATLKAGEADDALRTARNRKKSQNNLRQIGIALHNHHNSMGVLPAATITDKEGKPLLSWRVAILPYIEQQALFNQFKRDEPWDSEHNKKLLAKMPAIYAPLGVKTKEPFTTFYQAFVGKGAAFEGSQGLKFAAFTDGTSNTVLIAEAAEPVPWTKPDDLVYDPEKELPKLGGLFADGFHALFGDASIRFIKKGTDEKMLRALITRAGGEAVSPP